jgi:adenylosuccinate lyase
LRIDELGVPALFTEAARFQSWLDLEASPGRGQPELGIIPEGAGHEIVRKVPIAVIHLFVRLRSGSAT